MLRFIIIAVLSFASAIAAASANSDVAGTEPMVSEVFTSADPLSVQPLSEADLQEAGGSFFRWARDLITQGIAWDATKAAVAGFARHAEEARTSVPDPNHGRPPLVYTYGSFNILPTYVSWGRSGPGGFGGYRESSGFEGWANGGGTAVRGSYYGPRHRIGIVTIYELHP